MEKLSEHFSRHEFGCHGVGCCGHSAPIDYRFPKLLEYIRRQVAAHIGQEVPLKITSGFRCQTYNRFGSTPTSQHTVGLAVDVQCPPGIGIDDFAALIKKALTDFGYKGGIGKYPSFVHCDLRGQWAAWDER